MNMPDLYENLFKIIIVGDWGVGKSSILLRVINDEFYPSHLSTIGVEFLQKLIDVHKKKTLVQVWDTAGQDRYMCLTSNYYRSAVGALLVYDVTNRKSFLNLGSWLKEIRAKTSGIEVMVVGNKIDLKEKRTVYFDEGFDFAKDNGCMFAEVSALSNEGICDCFEELLDRVYFENNRVDTKRSASRLSNNEVVEEEWTFERCRKRFCCLNI